MTQTQPQSPEVREALKRLRDVADTVKLMLPPAFRAKVDSAIADVDALASPVEPWVPTPHQPIAGDPGVKLWSHNESSAVNPACGAEVEIDGERVAYWDDRGNIAPDASPGTNRLPRAAVCISHDFVKLGAYVAEHRAKVRAEREASKSPAVQGEANKPLWAKEQRYINRAGALKGFGNAIVPQLAAEFVAAFMDLSPSPAVEAAHRDRPAPTDPVEPAKAQGATDAR